MYFLLKIFLGDAPYQTEVKLVDGQLVSPDRQVVVEIGESNFNHKEREKKEQQRKAEIDRQIGNITIIGYSSEQCIVYARRISGNQKIRGYAGNLNPEGFDPSVGAVALEPGHVAVVMDVGNSAVVLQDANYYRGKITRRVVSVSSLKGFIF